MSELNLIVLHPGNGAGAAAISGGLNVDTSMGTTRLEGGKEQLDRQRSSVGGQPCRTDVLP
ncbi:hypothetical protein [Nonomuraea aridisoli]|uniref:hypothetical protein n=1 Tax=Nonomuraea aridisoli TaxID=2070368 RepID=UPI000DA792B9|nr:hypothetical protein [Nonomuraea aridisoli]